MITNSGVRLTKMRRINVYDHIVDEETRCVVFFLDDFTTGVVDTDEVTFSFDEIEDSIYSMDDMNLLVSDLLTKEYEKRRSKRGASHGFVAA